MVDWTWWSHLNCWSDFTSWFHTKPEGGTSPNKNYIKLAQTGHQVAPSENWLNWIVFNQVWLSLIQFDQVWSTLFQFDPVWSCSIKFDQSWSGLFQFDQVWLNLIKLDQLSSKFFGSPSLPASLPIKTTSWPYGSANGKNVKKTLSD